MSRVVLNLPFITSQMGPHVTQHFLYPIRNFGGRSMLSRRPAEHTLRTHKSLRLYGSRTSGFSILELLVAISALTAVLGAFAYSFRSNINQISSASKRISADNLVRSLPAKLTSRTMEEIKRDFREYPELKIVFHDFPTKTTGQWRPYKITIHRISGDRIDFVYEIVRLVRMSNK